MSRSLASIARALLLLPLATVVAASETAAPERPVARQEAIPVAADPTSAAPTPADEISSGPVHATDPAAQARIEELNRERDELQESTLARLQELGRRAAAEPDLEAQRLLGLEGVQLKLELQRRHLELGLQIARLNGDETKAFEFEEALHAFHHRDSAPASTPDPELLARRLRELGIHE